MPIRNEMDLPIEPLTISGPAVEELKNRKEDNNHERATAAKFRENFQHIKHALFSGLRQLTESPK